MQWLYYLLQRLGESLSELRDENETLLIDLQRLVAQNQELLLRSNQSKDLMEQQKKSNL